MHRHCSISKTTMTMVTYSCANLLSNVSVSVDLATTWVQPCDLSMLRMSRDRPTSAVPLTQPLSLFVSIRLQICSLALGCPLNNLPLLSCDACCFTMWCSPFDVADNIRGSGGCILHAVKDDTTVPTSLPRLNQDKCCHCRGLRPTLIVWPPKGTIRFRTLPPLISIYDTAAIKETSQQL